MSDQATLTAAQTARIHAYQADSATASLRKGVQSAAAALRRAADDLDRHLVRFDAQVAAAAAANWTGDTAQVRLAADTTHTAVWAHANLNLDALGRYAADAALHAALRDALGGADDIDRHLARYAHPTRRNPT